MLDVGLYFYVLGLSVMSILYVLDIRRYISSVASMMDCVLSGSLLVVFSLFCYAICVFFEQINSLSLCCLVIDAFHDCVRLAFY